MGRVEEDVMYDWNNISKTVTVSSFYIDETEVRNIDYLEYLEWIKKHYVYENSPFLLELKDLKFIKEHLPDRLVWRDKLGENEMFLNNYLRHPTENILLLEYLGNKPNDYCVWRTDRVNERILIELGILWKLQIQIERSRISIYYRWILTR